MNPANNYWMVNFNTPLESEEEELFQQWLATQSKARKRDVSGDLMDYDLRGYWKSTGNKDTSQGHFPDTFKKPNHPSFSNESRYSGYMDPWGGKFQGGRWLGSDEGGWSFQPSERMLRTTHNGSGLRNYFKVNEPDVTLMMPYPK